MRIKTSYIANDDTVFDTEAECLDYEARKNKQNTNDVELLNRFCKFFNSEGKPIQIDYKFKECDVYSVKIKCTIDEAEEIVSAFGRHFDSLYYALEASDFQEDYEVILVYDWTGSGGWKELNWEQQEYCNFVAKVLNGA